MRPKTFSITTLIDLSLASRHEEVRRVREARDLYLRSESFPFDPDYYRLVKDGLEQQLRAGQDPDWLLRYLAVQQLDATKARHVRRCAEGLSAWVAKNRPIWTGRPNMVVHREAGVAVRVNPELTVTLRSGRTVMLKLYLKEPEASQARLAGPLYLLDVATRRSRDPGVIVGILDARRGRVFTAGRLPATANITASTEIESLGSIWDKLDAQAP